MHLLVLSPHVTRNLDALRKELLMSSSQWSLSPRPPPETRRAFREVSDVRVERALALARLHAPKIANQMKVRGNQQVQIPRSFAEVSPALREIGVGFFHNGGDRLGGITPP